MRCQCPGCEKVVPSGRRKYCSRKCGRIAYRQETSLRQSSGDLPRRKIWGAESGTRSCLKCGDYFRSTGRGNRICDRCSQKNLELSTRCATTPGPVRSFMTAAI